MQKLHVLVAIPNRGDVCSRMMFCFLDMLRYFHSKKVPGYDPQSIQPFSIQGTLLPKSRWMSIKEAMRVGASHLLFLDTDQTFPAVLLHRLLSHNVSVVGANVAVKKIPSSPTARKKGPHLGGEMVYTDEGQGALEEVWRLGTGIMLMRRDAFSKLEGKDFEIRWIEAIEDFQGEDWTMCAALERHGIPIHVDHLISWETGHIGNYEYKHDVVGELAT